MFYSEKIIDGVMHWKNHPDGEWIPYTVKTLTARYASLLRAKHELDCMIMNIHEMTGQDK